MSDFMQREITKRLAWWQAESKHQGTVWAPCDDFSGEQFIDDCLDYQVGEDVTITRTSGYGARLSAPGYLDCTEWCVFNSVKAAEEYLTEMYGDDDSEETQE